MGAGAVVSACATVAKAAVEDRICERVSASRWRSKEMQQTCATVRASSAMRDTEQRSRKKIRKTRAPTVEKLLQFFLKCLRWPQSMSKPLKRREAVRIKLRQ